MEKINKTNKKKVTSLLVLLAAILLCLAAVLGMGGFTYAKYISGKTVSSTTANVAKWGYVVSVDSSKLFGDAYGYDSSATNQTVIAYSTTGTTVGVKAKSEGTSLVAPGTEGSVLLDFRQRGSAEQNHGCGYGKRHRDFEIGFDRKLRADQVDADGQQ